MLGFSLRYVEKRLWGARMLRRRPLWAERGGERCTAVAPAEVWSLAEPETQPGALRHGTPRGPRPTVGVTIEAHPGDVARRRRGAGSADPQPVAAAQPHARPGKEGRRDGQQAHARHLRIEAERAEDVPGGHLTE